MTGIFISYRREDTRNEARRLERALVEVNPSLDVFLDVSDIEPAVDWARRINEAFDQTDCVLILIGRKWLTTRKDGKRRLDDPDDTLRYEIAEALRRGLKILPVLVGKAKMPDDKSLPSDVRELTKLQATDSPEDATVLVKRIAALTGTSLIEPKSSTKERSIQKISASFQRIAPKADTKEAFNRTANPKALRRWWDRAQSTLREILSSNQLDSTVRHIDDTVRAILDGDGPSDLGLEEIIETLDKMAQVVSAISDAKPGTASDAPLIFDLEGDWRCEMTEANGSTILHFTLSEVDQTFTGTLASAQGRFHIDGKFGCMRSPLKSEPEYIILEGVVDRRQQASWAIPVGERMGNGWFSDNKRGTTYFLERLEPARRDNKTAAERTDLFKRAHAHFLLEEHDQQLDLLDQIIRLDPAWPVAHGAKGFTLATIGKLDEAERSFRTALQLDDSDHFSAYHLARINMANQQWHAAERLLRSLTNQDLDPTMAMTVHRHLGDTLVKLGRGTDALPEFDRALGLVNKLPPQLTVSAEGDVLASRGLALLELDRASEAVEDLERAFRLKPDDASVWYNAACAYSRSNRGKDGIDALARAFQLEPNLKSAGQQDSDLAYLRSKQARQFRMLLGNRDS